jgi:hypothetical protein
MATDERAAEIELRPHELRAVALELDAAGAEVAEPLPLADEVTDLGLERLDIAHVLPQADVHRWMYRHPSRRF